MMSGTALVLIVLATVLLFAATVFKIRPAVARARFVEEMTLIRDECDDAVIHGDLDWDGPARNLIERSDWLIKGAAQISLSSIIAAHTLRQVIEVDKEPSYAACSAAGRKILHDLDRRSVRALATYLGTGSSLWLLFAVGKVTLRIWGRSSQARKTIRARGPFAMAKEYTIAVDEKVAHTV